MAANAVKDILQVFNDFNCMAALIDHHTIRHGCMCSIRNFRMGSHSRFVQVLRDLCGPYCARLYQGCYSASASALRPIALTIYLGVNIAGANCAQEKEIVMSVFGPILKNAASTAGDSARGEKLQIPYGRLREARYISFSPIPKKEKIRLIPFNLNF